MLYAGIPNNENGAEEEKAFPDALYETIEMPLAVDYRGFDARKDRIDKGAFENAWYTLLANLFDVGLVPRSSSATNGARRASAASSSRSPAPFSQ